jgi:hypothetical protein
LFFQRSLTVPFLDGTLIEYTGWDGADHTMVVHIKMPVMTRLAILKIRFSFFIAKKICLSWYIKKAAY